MAKFERLMGYEYGNMGDQSVIPGLTRNPVILIFLDSCLRRNDGKISFLYDRLSNLAFGILALMFFDI
jgi:hypothetical protein